MVTSQKKYYRLVIALILAVMFFLQISSLVRESQTVDEGTHLASGYAYWLDGNFQLNPEHPPLLKYLAATPLLFLDLEDKMPTEAYRDNNQWEYGRQLVHNNRASNKLIINLGRLPTVIISLLLVLIIYKLGKNFFSPLAGLLAAGLLAFDPNILAHSRYITTDLPITFALVLAIYTGLRYNRQPTKKNLLWLCLSIALAALIKFSFVIIIPVFLLLYLIKVLKTNRWQIKKMLVGCLLIFATVYFSIFLAYQLELKKPIEDPTVTNYYSSIEEKLADQEIMEEGSFHSVWLKLTDPSGFPGNSIKWFSENMKVPAYSYFKGFYTLARHNYFGHRAYLLGNYSNTGWWYYFPIAFLTKTPLATIILLILAVVYFILINAKHSAEQAKSFKTRLKIFFAKPIILYSLLITPLLYFLWTLTSKLNLGLRHLLPVYPFIYLAIGIFLAKLWPKQKQLFLLALLFVFYLIGSSLWTYPDYLAYFNEAVGGPSQGHKYLTDSNLDWGQGLIQLQEYLRENNIEKVYLHYFGSVDPASYGINWQSPPDNQAYADDPGFSGTVAISVTALYDNKRDFAWLLDFQPETRLGYSLWVYRINQ